MIICWRLPLLSEVRERWVLPEIANFGKWAPVQPQFTVTFDRLKAFIHEAMLRLGLPDDDAMAVTDPDGAGRPAGDGRPRRQPAARNMPAHQGSPSFNVRPNIRVVQEHTSPPRSSNGDNGMGHLVMKPRRRDRDRESENTGIGWMSSRDSNHAGPASLYARMPLDHDMIGLYFAVGNANRLPPWGGLDMLLSTNPIAVGVPAVTSRRSCSTWPPLSQLTAR